MPLEIEKIDRLTVITVAQPTIEENNAMALWNEIEQLLSGADRVVVDLSRVDFIDSTGCGVFPNCANRLAQKDGELKISGLSGKLNSLFRLMAFDRLMDFYKTREEAIAAFEA